MSDCIETLCINAIAKQDRYIKQQQEIIKTQQQLIEKLNEYIVLLKNRL